ncbi:MFS transporter [Candidatus Tisiphia endosymbiont of Sialis lutaria]|uniref:MFS transporter n=1 Tax=Candidatus Tisiphia endosymbiont of Sialis lutaria TaxID=2029164 RepID=UPI00312CBC9A
MLVSLGAGLEYYDFVIYGVMAYYLSELFFPNVDSSISIIKSFSVFTVGYIARPVGSIIFGFLGDKFGRKSTFALSMLLITVSTLAISILPTYNTISFKAIMLLVFFRIIQGISFAAELQGATTFINESSAPNKSGFYSGILMVSIGIGDITASFTVFLLTYLIGQKGIVEWGWRIPFFLGGVFAFISFYFRRNIYETPEFVNYAKTGLNNKSIKDLYKEINWLLIVTGIAISLLGAFLVVFNLYLPVYLSKYFGYDLSSIYFFTLLGIIVATILSPVFGLISDKMGAINILLIHVLILPICSLLIFLFYTKEIIYPALLIFIYQITSYSFYTGFLVLLGRLFPVSITR